MYINRILPNYDLRKIKNIFVLLMFMAIIAQTIHVSIIVICTSW